MVKYKILGDYFFNNFHLAKDEGKDSADFHYIKKCPADTDLILWETLNSYASIDKVIESSFQGHQNWSCLGTNDRIGHLQKYEENLQKRQTDLATAISEETGKPLWESQIEVKNLLQQIKDCIDNKLRFDKSNLEKTVFSNLTGKVYYKSLGPVLVISSFNDPCERPHFQILTNLLAGNSIIFKPSEKCIYSAQIIIECFNHSNFPLGVVNFINGPGEIVHRLIKEPTIKAVFHTGSKESGKKILQTTHKDLQKLIHLSLSGKNYSIVDKDCDFDYALLENLKSTFHFSGQKCTSTSIIFVFHKLVDSFIDKFHQLSKKIIIDHPLDHERSPFMGPLINEQAVQNYLVYMGMAIREGADEVMRGKQIEKSKKGYYVSPSIHYMSKVEKVGHYLYSELLGPNCLIIPFMEIEEILQIANKFPYGLSASYFGHDQKHFNYLINNSIVGLFNYNLGTNTTSLKLPYLGHKNSGNFRSSGPQLIEQCHLVTSSLKSDDILKVDFNKTIGL